MIQLNQIELRRGAKLLFENASLQAHAGQRMGIIGVNGSGKSSLFALILGQLEADAGQLQVNPKDVIAHVAEYKKNKRYKHLKLKVPNCHSHLSFNRNGAQTGQLCMPRSTYWPDTAMFFAKP